MELRARHHAQMVAPGTADDHVARLWLLGDSASSITGSSARKINLAAPDAPHRRNALNGPPRVQEGTAMAASSSSNNHVVTEPFDRTKGLLVSSNFLTASYAGPPAFYSLWLGQACVSTVVVHVMFMTDSIRLVRLSSDRIIFTPDNYHVPQLIRVELMENCSHSNMVAHRVFSLDKNFDKILTPNVVIKSEWSTPGLILSFGGQIQKKKAALGEGDARFDLTKTTKQSLGIPDKPQQKETVASAASVLICHVASGGNFTVVGTTQQSKPLLSWGSNTSGELGIGCMTSYLDPQPVCAAPMQSPAGVVSIVTISCGKHHAAVVTTDGRLFTWGNNKYGQLGHGDYTNHFVPQEVHYALGTLSSPQRALRIKHTILQGGPANVTHVCCGAYHTLFVTHQQQVLAMGYNQAGQLGIGHRLQALQRWRSCNPISVTGLCDRSILDIAAGQNHSACVLSNGEVFVWGCGEDGRLGVGDGDCITTPAIVPSLRELHVRVRAVRCGGRHTAVISDRDLLYMWGANEFGQLGLGDNVTRRRPCLITFSPLVAEGVADVALGEFHTACITYRGRAYAWGLDLSNDTADLDRRSLPLPLHVPTTEQARRVSCGWTHTNILTQDSQDPEPSAKRSNFYRRRDNVRQRLRREEVDRWRMFTSAMVSIGNINHHHEWGRRKTTRQSTIPQVVQKAIGKAKQSDPEYVEEQNKVHRKVIQRQQVTAFVHKTVSIACKNIVAKLLDKQATDLRYSTALRRANAARCASARRAPPQGIFLHYSLQPPAFPTTPTPPARKLTLAKMQQSRGLSPRRPMSATCSPRPSPSPRQAHVINSPTPSALRDEMMFSELFCASTVDTIDTAERDCERRRLKAAHTTHHQLGAVEALMHRPTFNITPVPAVANTAINVKATALINQSISLQDVVYLMQRLLVLCASGGAKSNRGERRDSSTQTHALTLNRNVLKPPRRLLLVPGNAIALARGFDGGSTRKGGGSGVAMDDSLLRMAALKPPRGAATHRPKHRGKAVRPFKLAPGHTTSLHLSEPTVLPRIDGRPSNNNSNHSNNSSSSQLHSHSTTKPALLHPPVSPRAEELPPPQRRVERAASVPEAAPETTPTGPSLKHAWSTPRAMTDEERSDPSQPAFSLTKDPLAEPTPDRLLSAEESLATANALYRIDLDALYTGSNKILEITATAQQHVEALQEDLPATATKFQEATSALELLSSDIGALHEHHEATRSQIMAQLDSVFSQGTEERLAMLESHLAEKEALEQSHRNEVEALQSVFRTKVEDLEAQFETMDQQYRTELRETKLSAAAELEAASDAAATTLQQVQQSLTKQLEELQARTQAELLATQKAWKDEVAQNNARAEAELTATQKSANERYQQLESTSQEAYAQLQTATADELVHVRTSTAAQIADLTARYAKELEDTQRNADATIARLNERHSAERSDILQHAAEELTALRMGNEEQRSRLEERRQREVGELERQLDQTIAKYEAALRTTKTAHAEQIDQLTTTTKAQLAAMETQHHDELERRGSEAATELSRTKTSYEMELRELKIQNASEVEALQASTTAQLESTERSYESQLQAAEVDRMRERELLVIKCETELGELRIAHHDQLDQLTKAHDAAIQQLRDVHNNRQLALESEMREAQARFDELHASQTAMIEAKDQALEQAARVEADLRLIIQEQTERTNEQANCQAMVMAEHEAVVHQLQMEKQTASKQLEDARRDVRRLTEEHQTKVNTILELTFVIRSRDEEVEKLRNSLLDSIKQATTKTEILELTAETLSTKARELEDTKAALRIESGRLSMVEESMHHKMDLLEDTELKLEHARLHLENMRLELKRLQMDMKLQLEHTEGEMELKNGEIRRLQAAQSELKQKHEHAQLTTTRLEESLAFTQRQSEELQRRVELLKLEAAQRTEEERKTHDLLLEREQDVLVLQQSKQTALADKQRLQIQVNNLTHVMQLLREQEERSVMRVEDIQTLCLVRMAETAAEKDERMRLEKHSLLLELTATKELLRHYEDVETRLRDSMEKNEELMLNRTQLESQIKKLEDSLTHFANVEALMVLVREENEVKKEEIAFVRQQLAQLREAHARDDERASKELSEANELVHRLTCDLEEKERKFHRLEENHSALTSENQRLHDDQAVFAQSMGDKMTALVADKRELLSQLDKRTLELQEQREDLTTVKGELEALRDAHQRLEHDLASALKTGQALRGDLEKAHHLKDKLTKHLETLQAMLAQEREALAEARESAERDRTEHDAQMTEQAVARETLKQVLAVQMEALEVKHALDQQRFEDTRSRLEQSIRDVEDQLSRERSALKQDLRDAEAAAQDERQRCIEEKERWLGNVQELEIALNRERAAHATDVARAEEELRERSSRFLRQLDEKDATVAELRRELEQEHELHVQEVASAVVALHAKTDLLMQQMQEKERVVRDLEAAIQSERNAHVQDVVHADEVLHVQSNEFARKLEEKEHKLSELEETYQKDTALVRMELHNKTDELMHELAAKDQALQELRDAIDEEREGRRQQGALMDTVVRRKTEELTKALEAKEAELEEVEAAFDRECSAHLKDVERADAELQEQNEELAKHRVAHSVLQQQLQELTLRFQAKEMEVVELETAFERESREHLKDVREADEELHQQTSDLRRQMVEQEAQVRATMEADLRASDERARLASNTAEKLWHEVNDKTAELHGLQDKLKELNETLRCTCEDTRAMVWSVSANHGLQSALSASRAREHDETLAVQLAATRQVLQTMTATAENLSAQLSRASTEAARAKSEATARYESATAKHQEEVDAAASKHSEEMNAAAARHKEILDAATATHQEALTAAVTKYEEELTAATSQHIEELVTTITKHQGDLAAIIATHEEERVAANAKHEAELFDTRARHKDELETTTTRYQYELDTTVAHHKQELDAIQAQLEDADIRIREQSELIALLRETIAARDITIREHLQVIQAQGAAAESTKKEFQLLREALESTPSSDKMIALLRQQLETFLLETYQVGLAQAPDFTLVTDDDLLEAVKSVFHMRCTSTERLSVDDMTRRVLSVPEVQQRLRHYEELVRLCVTLFWPHRVHDGVSTVPPSDVLGLLRELSGLKAHVEGVLQTQNASLSELTTVLLQHEELFRLIGLPQADDARGKMIEIRQRLEEHEALRALVAQQQPHESPRTMSEIKQMLEEQRALLAKARDVTSCDEVVQLRDISRMLDEYAELRHGFEALEMHPLQGPGSHSNELARDTRLLRGNDMLALMQSGIYLFDNCRAALRIPNTAEVSSQDIEQSISDLMRIPIQFGSLQETLRVDNADGSSSNNDHVPSMPTSTAPTSASSSGLSHDSGGVVGERVMNVLSFFDELQLIANLAKTILDDEVDTSVTDATDQSPHSSQTSFASLNSRTSSQSYSLTLSRSPTSRSSLSVDTASKAFAALEDQQEDPGDPTDQPVEASRDDGHYDNADDAVGVEEAPETADAAAPAVPATSSPPLTEPLLDISLVMSDHQRLMAEAARWIGKRGIIKRQHNQGDLGSEIRTLLREHCALLSLARRLFDLRDARHDLSSLLECVAIIARQASRLELFPRPELLPASSSHDSLGLGLDLRLGHDTSSASLPSNGSVSRLVPMPEANASVFTLLEDVARHLQDYDYLLQALRRDESKAKPAKTVEMLADDIAERLGLLNQIQVVFDLPNPTAELPQVLFGLQELVTSANKLLPPHNDAVVVSPTLTLTGEGADEQAEIANVTNSDSVRPLVTGARAFLNGFDTISQLLEAYADLVLFVQVSVPDCADVSDCMELKQRLSQHLDVTSEHVQRLEADLVTTEDELSAVREQEIIEDVILGTEPSPSAASPSRIDALQALVARQAELNARLEQWESEIAVEKSFVIDHQLADDGVLDEEDAEPALWSHKARMRVFEGLVVRLEKLANDKTIERNRLLAELDAAHKAKADVEQLLMEARGEQQHVQEELLYHMEEEHQVEIRLEQHIERLEQEAARTRAELQHELELKDLQTARTKAELQHELEMKDLETARTKAELQHELELKDQETARTKKELEHELELKDQEKAQTKAELEHELEQKEHEKARTKDELRRELEVKEQELVDCNVKLTDATAALAQLRADLTATEAQLHDELNHARDAKAAMTHQLEELAQAAVAKDQAHAVELQQRADEAELLRQQVAVGRTEKAMMEDELRQQIARWAEEQVATRRQVAELQEEKRVLEATLAETRHDAAEQLHRREEQLEQHKRAEDDELAQEQELLRSHRLAVVPAEAVTDHGSRLDAFARLVSAIEQQQQDEQVELAAEQELLRAHGVEIGDVALASPRGRLETFEFLVKVIDELKAHAAQEWTEEQQLLRSHGLAGGVDADPVAPSSPLETVRRLIHVLESERRSQAQALEDERLLLESRDVATTLDPQGRLVRLATLTQLVTTLEAHKRRVQTLENQWDQLRAFCSAQRVLAGSSESTMSASVPTFADTMIISVQRLLDQRQSLEARLAQSEADLAAERTFWLASNVLDPQLAALMATADNAALRQTALAVFEKTTLQLSQLREETRLGLATQWAALKQRQLVDAVMEESSQAIDSVRAELYDELVAARQAQALLQTQVVEEQAFIESHGLAFDAANAAESRRKVVQKLVDGQNALIEEKLQREVEWLEEKQFLEQHALAFESRRRVDEQLVTALTLAEQQSDERREASSVLQDVMKMHTATQLAIEHEQPSTEAQLAERLRWLLTVMTAERARATAETRQELQFLESKQGTYPCVADGEAQLSSVSGRCRVYDVLFDQLAALEQLVQLREQQREALETQLMDCNAMARVELRVVERHEQALQEEHRHVTQKLAQELVRARELHEEAMIMQQEQHAAAIAALREAHDAEKTARHEAHEAEKQAMQVARESSESTLRQEQRDQAEQFELERQVLEAEQQRVASEHQVEVEALQAQMQQQLEAFEQERESLVAAHERHCNDLQLMHALALQEALEKQGQQLAFRVLALDQHDGIYATTSTTAAVSSDVATERLKWMDKLTKRDNTAIASIYKVIRLATDILNSSVFAAASASSSTSTSSRGTTSTGASTSADLSAEVTQAVLSCVHELKQLKDYLLDTLELVLRQDVSPDHPPFARVPGDLPLSARATDVPSAIDFALAAHREFMAYAAHQLATTQQEVRAVLLRQLELLARNAGAFTPEQRQFLELEVQRTQLQAEKHQAECQRLLQDEFCARIVEEQRALNTAHSQALDQLRNENGQLRAKLDQSEHERQTLLVAAQANSFGPPRTPTTPSSGLPMRPERPRDPPPRVTHPGSGVHHKERFVSDLERETGQRRSSNAVRRMHEWKKHELLSSSAQIEAGFRRLEASNAAHNASTMESAPPTRSAEQEVWFQGVRVVRHVSFLVSVLLVRKQQVFRVEAMNSDTEQQQTIYVTMADMEGFIASSPRGTLDLDDPTCHAAVVDVLFEHVRVYGDSAENMLLAFD
ncbi:TPA: hypothetical protein N0F65_012382 [Lagenidium giganteum]|uniref:RCC1-like domain-containing protein n=1 Tax=Lagenidium giganteum TaxID=4803 RepID=A0AAV2YSJ5_9STRA|nr:TPA: hypothetical protein N0F65_012382 [Lagenidium giganteum]